MAIIAPFRESQYPETTTTRCIKLYIPDHDSFLAILGGLLSLLGNELNYLNEDTELAASHAQIWRDSYLQTDWTECESPVTIPIGTIVYRATATLPDNWLYCNGDIQLKSAYPLLYDAIADTWGDVETLFPELENPELYFVLPDARDTFLLGYMQGGGSPTFASSGGSKTHTLTTSEIPAHTHDTYDSNLWALGSYTGVAAGIVVSGAGTTQDVNTGSAGGGGAHNNMPPYKAMSAIIYAGE